MSNCFFCRKETLNSIIRCDECKSKQANLIVNFKGSGFTKGTSEFPNGFQPSPDFRRQMNRGNIKKYS